MHVSLQDQPLSTEQLSCPKYCCQNNFSLLISISMCVIMLPSRGSNVETCPFLPSYKRVSQRKSNKGRRERERTHTHTYTEERGERREERERRMERSTKSREWQPELLRHQTKRAAQRTFINHPLLPSFSLCCLYLSLHQSLFVFPFRAHIDLHSR